MVYTWCYVIYVFCGIVPAAAEVQVCLEQTAGLFFSQSTATSQGTDNFS